MRCPNCDHRFEEKWHVTAYDKKGGSRGVEKLRFYNLKVALNSIEYFLKNWAEKCVLLDNTEEIVKEFKKDGVYQVQ